MSASSSLSGNTYNATPGHPGVFSSGAENIQWRSIPIDPRYEASNTGQVRNSRTWHVLKPWLAGYGYEYVGLGAHGVKTAVHRLVAMAFHGLPPGDRYEVAHFDGNALNNCAANLRWATRKENVEDQRRHGTLRSPVMRGSAHPRSKLSDLAIREIRQLPDGTESLAQIATRYGVCFSTIGRIKQGKTWTHLPL